MESLASWLKETIPGIVLLGAFGSLLAVYVLNKGKSLLAAWLPRFDRAAGRALRRWLGKPLEESLRFTLGQPSYELIAYFAYELGKLLLLPWAAFLSAFLFFRIAEQPQPELLGSVLLSLLFFLCVYESVRSFARLWYHRLFIVEGGLRDSLAGAIRETVDGPQDEGSRGRGS